MRRFGLIGKTLKHSFSKQFFAEKFRQQQLTDCSYEAYELSSICDLPQLLQQQPELEGFNVTIPYKEQVIPFLHQQDKVVQKTGACNCVKIINGELYGFNTDVFGFEQSLRRQLKQQHTHALILGTGGASKAVKYALEKMGISYRRVSTKGTAGLLRYSEVDSELLQRYTLLVNTTPVGMFPDTEAAPDIPYELITPQHFLFDLIYNPAQTRFLQLGAAQGAQTSNGYEMLVLQAEESWLIWNNAE
jgi:shikimate dehydrogenase